MPEYPEETPHVPAAVPEFHHSADYKDAYAAFIQAQGEFAPVAKTKTAKVKGRTKAGADYEYTYKYADLADVLAMALPVLTKHGLGLMQPHMRVDGQLRVVTMLIHSSGQWLQSYGLALPENLAPQDFGGLSTYWRRYDVCSFLGIVADEDIDAQKNAEIGSKAVRQPAASPSPVSDIVRPPHVVAEFAKTHPLSPAPAKAVQPATPGEELLAERDALIVKLKALVPDGKTLGQKAKAMFPEHQTTKTLTVADLQRLYEVLLMEKADKEKREAVVSPRQAAPPESMPDDIPPDVAAMFDNGTLTTASRLIGIPTIGKGLAQRLHKLIGIHKIHTEAELLEDYLKPLGLEHASDLPRDLYESLCDWAEGKPVIVAEGESNG